MPNLSSTTRQPASRQGPRPFTVGEVLRQVKDCLEDCFRPLLVVGEVADGRRPRSGHLYLTLRDETARLRVVVFSSVLQRMGFDVQDGEQVLVWGRITAYPRSGDVQLVADRLEPVGAGARQARRDQLHARLSQEGLFAREKKRRVPFMPRRIGLVTSPSGAAIRDVMTTIERRFKEVQLVLIPVPVNGAHVAPDVALGIRTLDRRADLDVILVVRGGGSREDLAAFDEESVVRAIANCQTPTIVGVGHETDVSLADLAADRRAATPPAAAELAVPVRAELEGELRRRRRRLDDALTQRLKQARRRLALASRAWGLQAPRALLDQHLERLARAQARLERAAPSAKLARWGQQLLQARQRLARLGAQALQARGRELGRERERLARLDLEALVARRRGELGRERERLARVAELSLEARRQALAQAALRLDALSPLRVLARGYSLTTAPDGRVVADAAQLEVGQRIHTRLAQGSFTAQVVATSAEPGAETAQPSHGDSA